MFDLFNIPFYIILLIAELTLLVYFSMGVVLLSRGLQQENSVWIRSGKRTMIVAVFLGVVFYIGFRFFIIWFWKGL